ncbi:MAG TPA: hypothetical protein VF928_12700 [Usitatibacteraceae bacterium]
MNTSVGILDHPPFYFPGTPRVVRVLDMQQERAEEMARQKERAARAQLASREWLKRLRADEPEEKIAPTRLERFVHLLHDERTRRILSQFRSCLWRCNSMRVYLIPSTGLVKVRRTEEFLKYRAAKLPKGAIEIGIYHWPCSSNVFFDDLQKAWAKATSTTSTTQGKEDGNDSRN